MVRLIAIGHDIDKRDRYGQTALMLATVHGHRMLADLLIRHRADLEVTAKYGLSALMLAVINGHVEIAVALVEAGADPNVRGCGVPGFAGKTAGDLAMERGFDRLADAIGRLRP